MVDVLVARGQTIQSLSNSLHRGTFGMAMVPDLLRIVLEDESWREFTIKGKHVTHDSFDSFVTRPPLDGLGAESVEQLQRLVADQQVLRDGIDKAIQRPAHRPVTVDNVNSSERTTGNATDTALRKLRKDRPDLHAQVLAEELSPHAAMVRAGFRPKTITVRLDDPERAAQSLIRNADPAFLDALLHALKARS